MQLSAASKMTEKLWQNKFSGGILEGRQGRTLFFKNNKYNTLMHLMFCTLVVFINISFHFSCCSYLSLSQTSTCELLYILPYDIRWHQ